MQLIQDVAGMTAAEADQVRRAFARPNNDHLIAMYQRNSCRAPPATACRRTWP